MRSLFDVNVIGVVNCAVACRETMKDRGRGVILNIASVAGHTVTSPYGVSKLAVRRSDNSVGEGVLGGRCSCQCDFSRTR